MSGSDAVLLDIQGYRYSTFVLVNVKGTGAIASATAMQAAIRECEMRARALHESIVTNLPTIEKWIVLKIWEFMFQSGYEK